MKRTRLTLALLCTLLAGSALAIEPGDPTIASARTGTADIQGEAIRAYLLEHPEVVREALEELQRRDALAAAATARDNLARHRDALFEDPRSPVLGNPGGDVTVVEFFDYHCGYCRRSAPAVAALLASDPGVRVVMKEFPILGPESVLAAKSALAAARQDRYRAFHDALFQAEALDASAIDAIAAALDLDMARFHADREDPAIGALLDGNAAVAAALGIQGTPAFIVGDQLVPSAIDADTLAALVQAVRIKHSISMEDPT